MKKLIPILCLTILLLACSNIREPGIAHAESKAIFGPSAPDDFILVADSKKSKDSKKNGDYINANYDDLDVYYQTDPTIHLTGTLKKADANHLEIKDEDGHTWSVGPAGNLDFTDHIGSQCDAYGCCRGEIDSTYNTPYIYLTTDDSHVSFSDGTAYYPNDTDASSRFSDFDSDSGSASASQDNSISRGGGNLVWIPTNGGTKYHSKSSCSNMKDPIQVPESEAIDLGFSACKRCW